MASCGKAADSFVYKVQSALELTSESICHLRLNPHAFRAGANRCHVLEWVPFFWPRTNPRCAKRPRNICKVRDTRSCRQPTEPKRSTWQGGIMTPLTCCLPM